MNLIKATIRFSYLNYSGRATVRAILRDNIVHNPIVVFDSLFYRWPLHPIIDSKLELPFPLDEKELKDHITDLADDAWVTTEE